MARIRLLRTSACACSVSSAQSSTTRSMARLRSLSALPLALRPVSSILSRATSRDSATRPCSPGAKWDSTSAHRSLSETFGALSTAPGSAPLPTSASSPASRTIAFRSCSGRAACSATRTNWLRASAPKRFSPQCVSKRPRYEAPPCGPSSTCGGASRSARASRGPACKSTGCCGSSASAPKTTSPRTIAF
eukprot:Amastigsp_a1439_94.p3 type:complete len:191 gc:universal Amastigsp_a1439_94:388-960(+)